MQNNWDKNTKIKLPHLKISQYLKININYQLENKINYRLANINNYTKNIIFCINILYASNNHLIRSKYKFKHY